MELTFTLNLLRNFMASPSARLKRLSEALASSSNCLADTVPVGQLLSELRGPELTGHLSISLTSKGLLHVTYTEEPTPS